MHKSLSQITLGFVVSSHASPNLKQVEYGAFKQVLKQLYSKRIRQHQESTYLFDQDNNLMAVLKQASFNQKGELQPPQYFINQQALLAA